jgi:hypothetical protein
MSASICAVRRLSQLNGLLEATASHPFVCFRLEILAKQQPTYVHVQCLAIASTSADRGGHNDQLVLCDKIPNAALFACGFVARVGLDVELEGCNERQEEGKEKLECEKHVGGRCQEAVDFSLARVVLAVCD